MPGIGSCAAPKGSEDTTTRLSIYLLRAVGAISPASSNARAPQPLFEA